MKLRQKLAVVLASAMVLTSVPVVTMAASTNSLTKETIKVAENEEFHTVATANAVRIKFSDYSQGTETFYLKLNNAEWDADLLAAAVMGETGAEATTKFLNSNGEFGLDSTGKVVVEGDASAIATAKYAIQDEYTLQVVVSGTIPTDKALTFPIIAKTKTGEASVAIQNMGGTTVSTSSPLMFATTSDKKVTAKVTGDIPSFYTSGEIAEITLEEAYMGAIMNSTGNSVEFKLELDDTDYTFDTTNLTIEGAYGFSAQGTFTKASTLAPGTFTVVEDKSDLTIKVQLDTTEGQDSIGTLKVKGLKVKTSSKAPETGDFKLDVKGDALTSTLSDAVVAKIAKYGTYIEMADEKAVEIVAGRIEDVEFTIGETVEGSMVANREFEITLDNGHYDYRTLVEKYAVNQNQFNGIDVDALTNKKFREFDGELNVQALRSAGLISDKLGSTSDYSIASIEFARTSDDLIDGTTLVVKLASNASMVSNLDEMTFNLPVAVGIANKDKETVKVSASGRALENEVSTTAVTIVNPFNIESEALTVKVGLQKQVGGKITLTETAKEMIQKGDIKFELVDADTGLTFAGDVTLKTEGGIKNTEIDTPDSGEYTTVTVNRTSKEAATITVEDFIITVDRTVPEGSYDLKISGNAIDEYKGSITVEDFIVVGTANTQDITAANGLAKGTAQFEIGKTTYTAIDGTEKTMDAASYIQDPGYTMVPVRYVAEAFGVSESDILFSKGVVTIFAGTRTVQLTSGSDVAVVNGAQVTMGTKVVIKDGRTYAPVGEIARILGISTNWDSATKTATFTNK